MAALLSGHGNRGVLLVLALLFTTAFAVSRVEAVSASGGCCGGANCNFLYETCNSADECFFSHHECCIGGCI